MSVKKICFKHPSLGEIVVHSAIEESINEQIGDVVQDYSKAPLYYHATIIQRDDNTFLIKWLKEIKPEVIYIGWLSNSKGKKSFITVITNKQISEDDIIVYPSAILLLEGFAPIKSER